MDALTKKTFATSRGYTYTYYLHKPSSATKPALVLCHGWPDNAYLWEGIVPELLESGHPLLLPDMLGYDGTSKPTDAREYSSKALAADLYELIDSEGFDKIIPVGHDWGSWMAQRLYIWRPERSVGLVLLNVAYQLPQSDTPFDLAAMNQLTEKLFGYPAFAYWELFGAEDGAKVFGEHLETAFHLLHWDDPEAMKKVFCVPGAMRELITTTSTDQYPLKPYAAQPGFKEAFVERLRRDGFEGPFCWYKSSIQNIQFEAEKEIPRENLLIKDPCLYISGTADAVCRTDGMDLVKQFVPDLTTLILEANHWVTFEKPVEVRERIASWLKEKYPAEV